MSFKRGLPGFNTPREQLESAEWAAWCTTPENDYFKINIQQCAKNPILMDCIKAPPGYKYVDLDFSALEPNVLAEFSKDSTYREVYASGKPHEIYMYIVCKLLDPDGVVSSVYKPEAPTKESVAAAKKQFKPMRTIGKVFQLMSTYKAGPPKIHRKLMLEGVDISFQQVRTLHKRYWNELFAGVLQFEQHLLAEMEQNNGWMFNGFDRPFAITYRKEKDIVNTWVQSTGHDCTDILVCEVERLFKERGIPALECVPDFHDETIWLVPDAYAAQAADLLKEALAEVNNIVKFSIPLTGSPEIADNWTTFKGPDPIDWYSARVKTAETNGQKKARPRGSRGRTADGPSNAVPPDSTVPTGTDSPAVDGPG